MKGVSMLSWGSRFFFVLCLDPCLTSYVEVMKKEGLRDFFFFFTSLHSAYSHIFSGGLLFYTRKERRETGEKRREKKRFSFL